MHVRVFPRTPAAAAPIESMIILSIGAAAAAGGLPPTYFSWEQQQQQQERTRVLLGWDKLLHTFDSFIQQSSFQDHF